MSNQFKALQLAIETVESELIKAKEAKVPGTILAGLLVGRGAQLAKDNGLSNAQLRKLFSDTLDELDRKTGVPWLKFGEGKKYFGENKCTNCGHINTPR